MDMISGLGRLRKTLGHDIFYSGVTANPPKDIADGFSNQHMSERRS